MTHRRRALLAALALAGLLALAGCDQHKGDPCSTPGSVYSKAGQRPLSCGPDGTWR